MANSVPPTQRLLGRLAEASWFSSNGEVAATRGLAMLLENVALKVAFLAWLSDQAEVVLPPIRHFHAERVHEDRSRPDLEGVTDTGDPIVVVEAKFRADLSHGQIRAYIRDQKTRIGESAKGIFLLIVPDARRDEARLKVASVLGEESPQPSVSVPVIATWTELIDVLDRPVTDLSTNIDSLAADLVQYRELCRTLGGMVIPPIGHAAFGPDWADRETSLRAIVDQVTRTLAGPELSNTPIGNEPSFLARRYFASGLTTTAGTKGSAASIGLQPIFASEGYSPVWMRFNKTTGGFRDLRDVVRASDYVGVMRSDGGHVWIPLEVDPDLGEVDLVADLVRQARLVQGVLSRPAE